MAEGDSDFSAVLKSCGVSVVRMTMAQAADEPLAAYDAFAVLADGKLLAPRLRVRLEEEVGKGKRLFTQALNSWGDIYSAEPADTTRRRLVVTAEGAAVIPGLALGDLLDDGGNRAMYPWYGVPGQRVLLTYRDHVIAHRRWEASAEEIAEGGNPGLWLIGDNVMMCAFQLANFNRARFAPRQSWQTLIAYIAGWLTGRAPVCFPEPVVWHGMGEDLSDDAVFETRRKEAVRRGIHWLRRQLVEDGAGGVREGLRHNIDPDGVQATAETVRTDCCGEAAGAFRFYGVLCGDEACLTAAEHISDFVFDPMMVKGGLLDGMLRWTDTGWMICYQDDAARALLPELYHCLFLGKGERFPSVCRALDFLVKTTAKDGCRVPRTDALHLSEDSVRELAEAEHGTPSAHYNAYYHAALLLAYLYGGNRTYLDTARKGLETMMALYPETEREQSETEEMCRLVLPLAALYAATGEPAHREMLFRVTDDLAAHRHPSGGYLEWDTGYRANCSRESRGECSLLTHNGDPVADLLYATNWLPVGYALAWRFTGETRFYDLWRDVAAFCLRSQARSHDPSVDGSWCRAFDLELGEVYACPHDVGWAANCSESGWTDAEILMGLMLPDVLARTEAWYRLPEE